MCAVMQFTECVITESWPAFVRVLLTPLLPLSRPGERSHQPWTVAQAAEAAHTTQFAVV